VKKLSFCLLLLISVAAILYAEEVPVADTLITETGDTARMYLMPQIDVISNKSLFRDMPGSVDIIKRVDLEHFDATNGHEIFRHIPGINAVDEEGAGMRINLGIRGLDPNRSMNVLMLEDGIPLQLNPYGEPEMYYTPPIERMSGIEVLKGSGQIIFGPQTIGGVINYLTPDPPSEPEGVIGVKAGQYGYFSAHAGYGTTFGKAGFVINYLHKQAKDLGVSTFHIDDITGKFKLSLSEKSVLGMKFQFYNEVSNSTYVGITQPMFDQGQYYPIVAPDDELKVRRVAMNLTHKHFFSNRSMMSTTAYYYNIKRDWRRQDFSYSKSASNQSGVIWGDTTVANGALYMLNSARFRNRTFDVIGLESRFDHDYTIRKAGGTFTAGIRLLGENARDIELNTTKPTSQSGTMRADEERPGFAVSGFVHNRFDFSDKWHLTAGIRFEQYWYNRDIYFSGGKDTLIAAESNIFAAIPGLGLNFNPKEKIALFTGVHRGFSPPVVKSAISNTGEAYDLGPQLSWNYELGMRSEPHRGLNLEATFFYMDFDKQVIPVSESSGAAGTGLINGGKTRHLGVETHIRFDLGKWMTKDYSLYLEGNFTYVNAIFNNDRFLPSGSDTINVIGNALPYAPPYFGNITVGYVTPFGLDLMFSSSFVASQYADQQNTEEASADGRTGVIPRHYTLDFTAMYHIPKIKTKVNLSVKNLSNSRYIASRRPQGIKVGTPVFFTAGLEVNF